jgi:hypothetical protein
MRSPGPRRRLVNFAECSFNVWEEGSGKPYDARDVDFIRKFKYQKLGPRHIPMELK